ncbi:MAG: DNA polymerase III subunit delta [Planctomycetes bacterium]|nr:DNA polymerase III subunit delta [Planctomycetota bacterium]
MARRRPAKDDDDAPPGAPTGALRVSALDLRARLAAAPPAPCYLVSGEEAFLRAEALAALTALPGAEVGEVEAASASLAAILDEARTLPFLGQRRVVVVRGASDLVAEHADALLAYLAAPPEAATLVLEAAKLDRRRKGAKALLERVALVDCEPPDAAGLMAFIRARARAHGGELARGADVALLERLGGHDVALSALDAEVQKLVTAAPGPVTAQRVAALASVGSSEESFALVDCIARGDVGATLGKLQTILRDGLVTGAERARDPSAIAFILLGILRWDLGRLLRGRAMLEAGRRSSEITSELKVYRDKDRFLARLRRASRDELGRRHEWLRQADAALKSGGTAFPVLTTLLVRLARCERPAPAHARA